MTTVVQPAKSWRRPPVPWRYLVALLAVGVVVGLIVAVVTREEPTYDSDRQQKLAADIGWPDGWIVADGPIQPNDESHRTETWFYAERSVAVRFLDGAEVLPPMEIDGALVGSRSTIKPTAFHRGMDLDAVEKRLGEKGTRIEPFDSPYEGSEGYLFVRSAVLVTILDGRFFTAQTY